MVSLLKRLGLYSAVRKIYHLFFYILVVPFLWLSSNIMKWFTVGNDAFPFFERNGFFLLRKHYYAPITASEELTPTFFAQRSQLPGIDINEKAGLHVLNSIIPKFADEFAEFPLQKPDDPTKFYVINEAYMAPDANVYYSLIRHFKPRRIIEIGSGNSTLLAAEAVRRNEADGTESELTCIEPFPQDILHSDALSRVAHLVEKNIQDVPLELFQTLQKNDILFIDSTHVLKAAGDVQYIYCELLPRLNPGVLVHVHDISLPKSYPPVYFQKNRFFWNEQYVLQTFLAFNEKFAVVWPGAYLFDKFPEKIKAGFPQFNDVLKLFPSAEPSSFWMKVE